MGASVKPVCVLGGRQWEHVAAAGSWGPQGRAVWTEIAINAV